MQAVLPNLHSSTPAHVSVGPFQDLARALPTHGKAQQLLVALARRLLLVALVEQLPAARAHSLPLLLLISRLLLFPLLFRQVIVLRLQALLLKLRRWV